MYYRGHPKTSQTAFYVLVGLQDGFRVGFSYNSPLTSARGTLLSTIDPKVVGDDIGKKTARIRMIRPLDEVSESALAVWESSPWPVDQADGTL